MKGQTLENMGNNWQSIDEWKLKIEGEMFYIENSSNNKVLGATIDGKVVEEDFVGGKGEQLWSKHIINNDGNFTLKPRFAPDARRGGTRIVDEVYRALRGSRSTPARVLSFIFCVQKERRCFVLNAEFFVQITLV